MDILNIPNVSPRRRRRMLREHQLRQEGYSLRQIAQDLDVSVATVHADLRLLEDQWNRLTRDIHDDLLLQQIARLDRRVERLSRIDPIERVEQLLEPEAQLSYEQIIQIEDRHERRLAGAERELRMLLKQLQNVNRHVWGATRSGDCPEDEIADPDPESDLDPEPDRTNLNKPERVQLAIPGKTLEIAPPTAPEKNLPEHLNFALPPNREAEALHLIEQQQAAQARGDGLAQVKALDKLVALYNP